MLEKSIASSKPSRLTIFSHLVSVYGNDCDIKAACKIFACMYISTSSHSETPFLSPKDLDRETLIAFTSVKIISELWKSFFSVSFFFHERFEINRGQADKNNFWSL